MKKFLTNPMTIVIMLLSSVLIGSNVCCTGHATNPEKRSVVSAEKNNTLSPEENTGGVITLTESTFNEKTKSGTVLVDFWAKWCGPCKIQSPIIEEVSKDMAGKASVYKLDIDNSPAIAERYNVQSIPTMIIFKNGNAVRQFTGLTQKSEIISAIENISKNN
jgi:thioredoxin 1